MISPGLNFYVLLRYLCCGVNGLYQNSGSKFESSVRCQSIADSDRESLYFARKMFKEEMLVRNIVLLLMRLDKKLCNYCEREFSGGFYRIKFHLNKDIVPCVKEFQML